jgi:DNA polymerase III epsilon subunit-like protein
MVMLNEILKSLTVIDTESTGLDTSKEEIVELATAFYLNDEWHAGSLLFDTTNDIPFSASAVHQISNRMVDGKPLFVDSITKVLQILRLENTNFIVAHNVGYDMPLLVNNFRRAGREEYLGKFLDRKNWICTLRLAKHLLTEIIEVEGANYKLNYLRYALDLYSEGDFEAAHRASLDTKVCADLLVHLIIVALEKGLLNADSDIGQQLSDLCWGTIKILKWPFRGKHHNWLLADIPNDYYDWALNAIDAFKEDHSNYDPDLTASVVAILSERLN